MGLGSYFLARVAIGLATFMPLGVYFNMGVEILLLVVLAVVAVAAFLFFSGAGAAAKASDSKADSTSDPTHVLAEDDSKARSFGSDNPEKLRAQAEADPHTEIRD